MEIRADVNGNVVLGIQSTIERQQVLVTLLRPLASRRNPCIERGLETGFGAMAARKSLISSPWRSANGGYCSLSDGSQSRSFGETW